jgi:flavin-binding protein dodecin
MANEFTKDGGVQDQIDATVIDAINRARESIQFIQP